VSVERRFGWLPEDPHVVETECRTRAIDGLLGMSPPELGGDMVLDYSTLLPAIPDQGATSSCVGQAFATALFLLAAIAGKPIPRPSAKLIYDFARAADRPYVAPIDTGSRALAAVSCLTTKGMVADEDWPIVFHDDGSTNINARPPLDIFQSALGFKVDGYYRIRAGAGASLLLRSALARGYIPVFAMPVDQPYCDLRDGRIYEGRKSKSLGGHMQAFGGFGDGFLRVVNSWGEGFGERGVAKISDDYVDSGECTDIIVVTAAATLVT
jgi:hypothetical protein